MRNFINSRFLTLLFVLMFTILSPTHIANAKAWGTSDKYGFWSDKTYTLRNNVWGPNPGVQSLWVNSYHNWGVWASHPIADGSVKSYPHIEKSVNMRLSSINTLTSTFNVAVPTVGASVSTDYDIWLDNHKHEVMLWMNNYGKVGPISYGYDTLGAAIPYYSNIVLGGHTWNIYRGTNGSNLVYSFVRTSNTNSGTVDIKAILNWIKDTQAWYGDVILDNVQFGFEITSSYNNSSNDKGYNFITNDYSISLS